MTLRNDAPPAPLPTAASHEADVPALQRALLSLRRARERIQSLEAARHEPIAIIGMACRFPGGGDTPQAFFAALCRGVDAVTRIPSERLVGAEPSAPLPRFAALLPSSLLEGFDADFFGIAPKEARLLDPQQRLLLELSVEAVADAGLALPRLFGSATGVFVGLCNSDYQKLLSALGAGQQTYAGTGTAFSTAAGRVSYQLGLQGPSLTVDTACSSSLVAVHLACQSLRQGDCDMALAGGANAILSADTMAAVAAMQALSPDGRCRAFDARANGFVRGEGAGLVALKRLSDARRDGDRIHAVLRASVVNQDGRSMGLTAPNVRSQQSLIRTALAQAGLAPGDVAFVETHGTGTPLGDPIEMSALLQVLATRRPADRPLFLGAVKTNIGHLEAAAGIAGLIKAVECLRQRRIPGNLHFRSLNPRIELPAGVVLPTEPCDWPNGHGPRVAGVSSFGISGTNAHVLIEAAAAQEASADHLHAGPESIHTTTPAEPVCVPQLVLVSAQSQSARAALAAALADRLKVAEGADPTDATRLADVAHSCRARDSALPERLGLVADSLTDLRTALHDVAHDRPSAGAFVGTAPSTPREDLVFVFSGQGGQAARLGQGLAALHPAYAATLSAIEPLVAQHAGFSLQAELSAPQEHSRLSLTQVAQPVLFAVQVALASLLQALGVRPRAVIGHSVGEIAAAHIAGALDLPTAVRLVCLRGQTMQGLADRGSMVSVSCSQAALMPKLAAFSGQLDVAALNDADTCVVSGDRAAVQALVEALQHDGIRCRALPGTYAFHSPQLDPLVPQLAAALGDLRSHSDTLPFYSTVTGDRLPGQDLGAGYWGQNLRQPVQFHAAVRSVLRDGLCGFVEIGPHPVLTPSLQRLLTGVSDGMVASTLHRDRSAPRSLLHTLAALYVHGVAIETAPLSTGKSPRLVSLPSVVWARDRHFVDGPAAEAPSRRAEPQPAIYTTEWKAAQATRASAASGRSWLLLGGPTDLQHALATALCDEGAQVCVEPQALPLALARHAAVDAIVVLSAVSDDKGDPCADRARALCQQVIDLLPALRQRPRALWLVTQAAHAAPRATPTATALWGLGRSLFLEHPELRGGLIDVDLDSERTASIAALASALASDDGEDEYTVRGPRRLVARLRPLTVSAKSGRAGYTARPDAAYVVTGAFGGLGPHLCHWLVRAGARHLVLLGRRGESAQPALAAALRQAGVHVQAAAIDVSDESALSTLLSSLTLPLAGVIHAAAQATYLPLGAEGCQDALASAFAAKAHGAVLLDRLTRQQPIDLFLLLSSAAAVWGGRAQAHYAAACAFLDGLAQRRHSQGRPAVSINFGVWEGPGMGDGPGGEPLRAIGMVPMPADAALEQLDRALSLGGPQYTIAAVDWDRFRPLYELHGRRRLSDLGLKQPTAPASTVSPDAPPPQAAPNGPRTQEQVRSAVRWAAAQALGLPSADALRRDRPLRELGLDSLMAVSLRDALAAWSGLSLDSTLVFTYPTVDAISDHLAQAMGLSFGSAAADTDAASPGLRPSSAATPENEPIAIVGMACRFPGGISSPADLWQVLTSERDVVGEVPTNRWDAAALFDPDPLAAGKSTCRKGGFLPDVMSFDAAFFEISPREAQAMDPQQRLLLEVAWESIERAGLSPRRLFGSSTGVFVGQSGQEYMALHSPEELDGYVGTGSAGSVASGRLSYFLGLRGPSLTIDTACSSSLVALHYACRSLRSGECSLALAGGVTLMLTPTTFIEFSRLRGIAKDGRCKPFSAAADGVGWSEGAGMLVLKRLSDARRDRDPILAVIRGSAVNQDGRSNGLTAPSGPAQEQVLRLALADAGLPPDAVDCVEAHGTGTALGDPIEAQALLATLAAGRSPDRPLHLGSIKSNLGHTQAASGVAGVIKAVLALQHERLPASLHADPPSPSIDWAQAPLRLLNTAQPWPRSASQRPRVIGVSSFGVSGTNAHVLLSDPTSDDARTAPTQPSPPAAQPSSGSQQFVIPLSARSPQALRDLTRTLLQRIGPDTPIVDLAHTLGHGRAHHGQRLATVARTLDDAQAALRSYLDQSPPQQSLFLGAVPIDGPPRLVFVFPGQGSQWPGMCRSLLAGDAAFGQALRQADAAIAQARADCGASAFSVEAALRDCDAAAFDDIDRLQPLLFACQVALCAHLQARGIVPSLVIGHSMGEVAAAHVAGALSLADAARVICRRSLLLRSVRGGGAMAVIEATEVEAEGLLSGRESQLAIAAWNSPRSVVVSGEAAALDALLSELTERAVFCRRIKVDVASHSPQVDPLSDALLAGLADLQPQAVRLPMISTVTGQSVLGPDLTAHYFVDNLRKPVRFAPVIVELAAGGPTVFLEVSSHPVLLVALEETLRATAAVGCSALPLLRRDVDDWTCAAEALAALYVRGVEPDWERSQPQRGSILDLPTYPFQRQPYLRDPRRRPVTTETVLSPIGQVSALPDLRFATVQLRPGQRLFQDHRIHQRMLAPGSVALSLFTTAAEQHLRAECVVVEDVLFTQPVELTESDGFTGELRIEAGPPTGAGSQCRLVLSSRADRWQIHASAQARRAATGLGGDLPAWSAGSRRRVAGAAFRDRLARAGLTLGPSLEGLAHIDLGDDDAIGWIRATAAAVDPLLRQATALDLALQVFGALWSSEGPTLPILAGIQSLQIDRPLAGDLCVYARRTVPVSPMQAGADTPALQGDLTVYASAQGADPAPGPVLALLRGIQLRPLSAAPDALPTGQLLVESLQPLSPLPPVLPQPGRWLIIADRDAERVARLFDRLQARLTAAGGQVYVLHPSKTPATELQRVIDDLSDGRDPPFVAALHLGALGDWTASPPDAQMLRQAQEAGCVSLLSVAQALMRAPGRQPPRLIVATRGTLPTPGTAVSPTHAPLWGLLRVVALEATELRPLRVDLDPASDDPQREADWLAALCSGDDGSAGDEDEQLFRGDQRLAMRLGPAAPHTLPVGSFAASADACYLIAGGLGGLGLWSARWLVQAGARHLLLLSRRGIETDEQKRTLEDLSADAEVVVLRADLCNLAGLQATLSTALHNRPPLRGVIHAAGELADGLVLNLQPDALRRSLSAKVEGAWNLQQATAAAPLDFFVLYASASTLLSAPGLGAYVAANRFLDALAHHLRSRGCPARSIDWGAFQAGVGGAALQAGRAHERGMRPYSFDEGQALFQRLMSDPGLTQIGAVDFDARQWFEHYPRATHSARMRPLLHAATQETVLIPSRDSPSLRSQLASAATGAWPGLVGAFVQQQAAAVLRLPVDDLAVRAPLRTLGMDSVMGLELRNRLESGSGLLLPATLVWMHPTVSALAEHLHERMSEAMRTAPDVAPTPATPDAPPAALAPIADAGDRVPVPDDDDALLRQFDALLRRQPGGPFPGSSRND
ncbi:MAG: SDR family NAD(P)-dependent oxidoreductase [Myxococcales bacterium]|nr:SDR family NAD(P)-dependent oxidoreductase [Myxococcales bacterium]